MLFQDFLEPAEQKGNNASSPTVLGSHHSSDWGRLEEVPTARQGFGAFAQWIWRLPGFMWSCEGTAQALYRNLSCFVMAALHPGGGWLFPGLPPFWRVCPTSQSPGLITWLISGQHLAPAAPRGPCQLEEAGASCSVSAAVGLFQVQLFGAVCPGC